MRPPIFADFLSAVPAWQRSIFLPPAKIFDEAGIALVRFQETGPQPTVWTHNAAGIEPSRKILQIWYNDFTTGVFYRRIIVRVAVR